MMDATDIRWNDEARQKILEDSDRVLREAVLDLAKTRSDDSADALFAEINSRMKGRFIDYEPGPDVRKYAEAIESGQFTDASGASRDAGVTDGPAGAAEDARGNGTTSGSSAQASEGAKLDSQNGNGVAADPGQGALAPDGDESDEVVNDG